MMIRKKKSNAPKIAGGIVIGAASFVLLLFGLGRIDTRSAAEKAEVVCGTNSTPPCP